MGTPITPVPELPAVGDLVLLERGHPSGVRFAQRATVTAVDPAAGRVTWANAEPGPRDTLHAAGGTLWVANAGRGYGTHIKVVLLRATACPVVDLAAARAARAGAA